MHAISPIPTTAGVAPPVRRTEDDFDFGSRRHVAESVDHVRFFAAHVFQFQFYQALCEAAGQYAEGDASKPLHKCSLYGSCCALDLHCPYCFVNSSSEGGGGHGKDEVREVAYKSVLNGD